MKNRFYHVIDVAEMISEKYVLQRGQPFNGSHASRRRKPINHGTGAPKALRARISTRVKLPMPQRSSTGTLEAGDNVGTMGTSALISQKCTFGHQYSSAVSLVPIVHLAALASDTPLGPPHQHTSRKSVLSNAARLFHYRNQPNPKNLSQGKLTEIGRITKINERTNCLRLRE